MKKKLALLAKYKNADALADSGKQADAFNNIRKADAKIKDMPDKPSQLKDAGDFKAIEDLFTESDKARHGLNGENKGAASTLFKRKVFNLLHELKEIKEPENKKEATGNLADAKTKENFYRLIGCIMA